MQILIEQVWGGAPDPALGQAPRCSCNFLRAPCTEGPRQTGSGEGGRDRAGEVASGSSPGVSAAWWPEAQVSPDSPRGCKFFAAGSRVSLSEMPEVWGLWNSASLRTKNKSSILRAVIFGGTHLHLMRTLCGNSCLHTVFRHFGSDSPRCFVLFHFHLVHVFLLWSAITSSSPGHLAAAPCVPGE